jgi:hypothetical protein
VESCGAQQLDGLVGGQRWQVVDGGLFLTADMIGGGAPPSALAGNFPRGWQHDIEWWVVLKAGGWLGGNEWQSVARSRVGASG